MLTAGVGGGGGGGKGYKRGEKENQQSWDDIVVWTASIDLSQHSNSAEKREGELTQPGRR